MRIGLPGGGRSVDAIVRQAERAEADGFTTLWYASAIAGDPLVAMALAGRATSRIELGTAVLQTYTCHPVLQAMRCAATAEAIGDPARLTIGVGPSHQPVVEGMLGMSYRTPGRHTDEYVQVLAPLLRGEHVDFEGAELSVHATAPPLPEGRAVDVLVGALGRRLLRVAGEYAAGTVLWMANARAISEHVAPRVHRAAERAGRAAPRIVAGVPVAVHDDVDEARSVAAEQFGLYATLPNYQRILEHGGVADPAEVALVGDEATVAAGVEELFAAGATDVWASPFPVGGDRSASRARTRGLLVDLAGR